MVKDVPRSASLSLETLHKVVFASLVKAGLALYGAMDKEDELQSIVQAIPPPYRAQINGKLYLHALDFLKHYNEAIESPVEDVILGEANLSFILDFLKEKVRRVGGVAVLDCGSIPEMVAIACKFAALKHNTIILDLAFVNPIGVTSFLTRQLPVPDREASLRRYAELLKNTLNAERHLKLSTIDLVAHRHGVTIKGFLESLNIQQVFDQINQLAKRGSVLVTADHGYDVVANESGLYITHGYKEKCPLNFSKTALFLLVN